LLTIFVVGITFVISFVVEWFLNQLNIYLNIIISSFLASIFIAHKMLYDSVKDVLDAKDKKKAISMLVSRDTKDMSESDIYKASIETYAENLSDGVVAPMFYLLLFNLWGIVVYKAVNTLDSMVGYRNDKYENYGKVSAILDDILNYIPSRLTAILIMLFFRQKKLFSFYKNGSQHDSPNAGLPITAMAIGLGVRLGGDTSYFGKIKHKAEFGQGRKIITKNDVLNAINFRR